MTTAAVATVTLTATVPAVTDATRDSLLVYGTAAIGASPLVYATKGIVCSFAGLDLKSSAPPLFALFWSAPAAGTSPSGYVYLFCPGTTQANGLLAIFQGPGSAAPLAELSASSIPAGVSSDVIQFMAVFPRV